MAFLRYIFILSGTSFVFHSSTYPRFHVQVCASWFAFNFLLLLQQQEGTCCPALPFPAPAIFFLVGLCCLTRVEGLCSIGLESKECMRCGGLFPAPSQIFIFYAELGGLFLGSDGFIERAPHWHFWTGDLTRVCTGWLHVHLSFFFFFLSPLPPPTTHTHTHKTIFLKREWTLKAEEAPRLARCPLSPPPLLHSPYLPPLFARQPPCSALMRGHPPLLGWRKGGVSPERSRDTRHVGCLLFFCFLCIFFFSLFSVISLAVVE